MTVSSQIIEVLNDLSRRFGIAIDWTQENVFPYLEELAGKFIQWEIATSTMWIAIGAILIVLGILCCVLDGKLFDGIGFGVVVLFIALVFGLSIIGCQTYDIITCKFLPEKEIIEYIGNLINQS